MEGEGAFQVFLGRSFAGVADQKAAMEKAKLRRNPSSGGCRVVLPGRAWFLCGQSVPSQHLERI